LATGTFELTQDSSGQYRFNLKTANGEVIASSEAYTTKEAALDGIRSVRNNAAAATIDDQTKS
jgi:uncharacterized protein YegP (UPF0339 family)